MFDRRHFLKIAGVAPLVLLAPQAAVASGARRRVLVLVELKGGNDGLNTVVPFADPAYRRLRPQLAIPGDQLLKLSDTIGLHPALDGVRASFDAGDVAIVQGVGYDHPNRSHFRSIEIWETASASDDYLEDGWLARALRARDATASDLVAEGVSIGGEDVGPLRGDGVRALTVHDPKRFFQATKRVMRQTDVRSKNPALAHVLQTQRELITASSSLEDRLSALPAKAPAFPMSRVGRQLEVAARLLLGDVPLMVVKVTHGSFDTHANQLGAHQNLLAQLDEALTAFRDAMRGAGLWEDVLVMTYSEFGRRAAQNGSRGTDHGAAAPQFFMGGRVKGGLY
ncbi:MAG: DUF1501 domain-containing protein, partial [Myxococcota bacterium]